MLFFLLVFFGTKHHVTSLCLCCVECLITQSTSGEGEYVLRNYGFHKTWLFSYLVLILVTLYYFDSNILFIGFVQKNHHVATMCLCYLECSIT